MRITFLSPCIPCPVRTGGQLRTLGLIRCLARFAALDVLAAGDPRSPDVDEAREALAHVGASLAVFQPTGPGREEGDAADPARLPDAAAHFRSPALRAYLASAPPPDLLHVEELVMAQYLDAFRGPAVLDRQKLDWAFHEELARAGGADAERHRREAERFRRWDRALCGRFAKILVTGASDRDALAPLHGASRIHVVPHGVDDDLGRPSDRSCEVGHVLLYGSLDYAPNVEALELYFREIWPRIRVAAPRLRTRIVGPGTPSAAIPRDDARVEVRGFVKDIAEVLRGPGALVVPVRVGGGIRTKILEALASGMPVVSTTAGAENLGLEPGRHFVLADTPADMAEAVLRLARDRTLAESLSRAGAAFVEEAGFRWEAIARRLEPIYREAVAERPRVPARSARVLLVGVRPWPSEDEARALSAPGHRTEQFLSALSAHEVEVVVLDEEGDGRTPRPGVRVLAPERFRAGRELREIHDRFAPDAVVAAGGYHAARVVALLDTDRPRWLDLPGDMAAEGQLRGGAGPAPLAEHLAALSRALEVGDRFSVIGASQRLALLGQLGLVGRLGPGAIGRDPVVVIPSACAGPSSPPTLPQGGLRVLFSGSYNTWLDADTLFAGLEQAMSRCSEIAFVSTGGPVPGHEETVHGSFWRRAAASRFAARFRDLGRVPRSAALQELENSHVLVCPSRACLEAELGSRQRLVEAAAHGRPSVVTALGDLPRALAEGGAGIGVAPGDPGALASALVRLAEDRALLASCAARARALWEERWTYAATTGSLAGWVAAPERWPQTRAAADTVRAELLRAQAELDFVRGSRSFRLLRALDGLLGRTRAR